MDLPNAHKIYSQVIVDEDVSETGNRLPVNLRMRRLQPIADSLCGFGKRLKITQDGILDECLTKENLLATLAIALYSVDAPKNMVDVGPVVPHKGIASRRTPSRIRELSELSSTTSHSAAHFGFQIEK